MDNKSEQTQPETNEKPQVPIIPTTSVEDTKLDEKCEIKSEDKSTADLDSPHGEDNTDKENITINEPIAAQELIKNSEESTNEVMSTKDSEKLNSSVIMKQIKVEEQLVHESPEKNEDIKDQDSLENHDEEEAFDDEEEAFDDAEETVTENTIEKQNDVKTSVLENKLVEEISEESSEVAKDTPQKTDDLPVNQSPAQVKPDRRLSRKTSSNSSNSASPSVEPAALVPIKKGNFYEHDNRDDKETENTELSNETKPEPKITPKKNSIDNKKIDLPILNSPKLEQSTSGSQENLNSERWSHDKFEKQQNEPSKPREKKPIEKRGQLREKRTNIRTEKLKINEKVNRESFNDEAPIQNFQEAAVEQARQKLSNKPNNRPSPVNKLKEDNLSQTVAQPEAVKQEQLKETAQKSKSKGLALSEYLEQNGDNENNPSKQKQLAESNDVKPKTNNRRPNMPTYQPQQRPNTNNDNNNRNNGGTRENKPVSNQQDNRNLKNRLDFSTRKPINSNNFERNDVENEYEIGTNRVRTSNNQLNQVLDDKNSKYNLKITANFESSTRIVQEEPVPLKNDPEMSSNFNNTNNNQSRPYSNRKYQSRTNEIQSQSNFNYNTKSNETYDEYFQEEDNFKIKKPFDKTRSGEKQQTFDTNNDLNRYIHNKPKMNQNIPFMNQNDPTANNNFTVYSDYAVYGNDQHYSGQQLPNSNKIQIKSQSYSNTNYRNNSNRNEQPQDFQRKQHHFCQQQQQQQSGFGPVFNTNNRPNNNRSNYESNNMQQFQQHNIGTNNQNHLNYIPNDNNFNIRTNF